MMLDNIDHYTGQIGVLDERIAVLCEPYERQVAGSTASLASA